MKRIGIIQPNYIPWPGYFEFIKKCDVFVLLDDVQYTTRDWRNRNRIRGGWLTIPVKSPHRAKINEVELSDARWSQKHWEILGRTYRKSPFFSVNGWIQDLYGEVATLEKLAPVNWTMLREIRARLGISTPVYSSSIFKVNGVKSERLIELCKALKATHYLSGPSARSYLDCDDFRREGIEVEWMTYSNWPKLSIVDWIFNRGTDF